MATDAIKSLKNNTLQYRTVEDLPKQAIFTSTIMTFLNFCSECNVPDTLDRCHNCVQRPYDTFHLFYCPNRPNRLH